MFARDKFVRFRQKPRSAEYKTGPERRTARWAFEALACHSLSRMAPGVWAGCKRKLAVYLPEVTSAKAPNRNATYEERRFTLQLFAGFR